jgi:hypothetical protein
MSSRPRFGKLTTDRREAFPELISLDLVVRQDPFRMHARHDWQRLSRFDETNFPTLVACLNARCQQGGLELENIIRFSIEGTTRYGCRGHDGTPKGRRLGDPCDNYFDVDLKVVRAAR